MNTTPTPLHPDIIAAYTQGVPKSDIAAELRETFAPRETPRTAAAHAQVCRMHGHAVTGYVAAEFARSLERELGIREAQVEQYLKDLNEVVPENRTLARRIRELERLIIGVAKGLQCTDHCSFCNGKAQALDAIHELLGVTPEEVAQDTQELKEAASPHCQ